MTAALTLYTRAGCHLCEEMKAVVRAVAGDTPLELREVDIDADPALRDEYNERIPLLFVNGRLAFKYRVDERSLRRYLSRL